MDDIVISWLDKFTAVVWKWADVLLQKKLKVQCYKKWKWEREAHFKGILGTILKFGWKSSLFKCMFDTNPALGTAR